MPEIEEFPLYQHRQRRQGKAPSVKPSHKQQRRTHHHGIPVKNPAGGTAPGTHHQSEGTEIQDANHIGKKVKQRQQHKFRYSDDPLPVKHEENKIKPDPYSRDKQSVTIRPSFTVL